MKVLKLVFYLFIGSLLMASSITEVGLLRSKTGQLVYSKVLMQFKIYDAPTAGNCLWDSNPMLVTVNQGMYSVQLGTDSNPLQDNVFSSTKDYYMEYWANDQSFSQREVIGTLPRSTFANKALVAETANQLSNKNIGQFINDVGYISGLELINTASYSLMAIRSLTSNASLSANYATLASTANFVTWSGIRSTPTTLGGYGVSDISTYLVNTANYAATANKLVTMNISQFINDSAYLKGFGTISSANFAITANYASSANYAATANKIDWNGVVNRPSTVSGYGILDDVALQVVNSSNFALLSITANYASSANFAATANNIPDGYITAVKVATSAISDAKIVSLNAAKLAGGISVNSGAPANSLVISNVGKVTLAQNLEVPGTVSASTLLVNGDATVAGNLYTVGLTNEVPEITATNGDTAPEYAVHTITYKIIGKTMFFSGTFNGNFGSPGSGATSPLRVNFPGGKSSSSSYNPGPGTAGTTIGSAVYRNSSITGPLLIICDRNSSYFTFLNPDESAFTPGQQSDSLRNIRFSGCVEIQ